MKRRVAGMLGEKLAQDFLRKQGYVILETNYRLPEGEIDIIARQQESVVFVEVRTKTGKGFGSPEESITPAKQSRLKTLASRYLAEHHEVLSWRIDMVAIDLSPNGILSRIELIENAVNDVLQSGSPVSF
jgi:putative endonuclease